MFVLSCELNEQVQTCADKIGLFKSGRVACTGNKPANCDEGKKKSAPIDPADKNIFLPVCTGNFRSLK